MVSEIAKIDTDMDLHNILTSASNFIKSPGEIEAHKMVDLEDKKIKEETRQELMINLMTLFPKAAVI